MAGGVTGERVDARLTALLGVVTGAVLMVGVGAAAVRSGGAATPARSPEEAARRLFQASVDGDCAELRALMTPRFRDTIDHVYPQRHLFCTALRAERGATLVSLAVRQATEDSAVVLITTKVPDDAGPDTTPLLFVRDDGRWRNASASLDCADPPLAEPAACHRWTLPE
jgi:hypothetical protein